MATDNLTIARPYAKAAFEYARDNKCLDTWDSFLTLSSELSQNSDMRNVIAHPEVADEKKLQLFQQLCKLTDNGDAINFLRLLVHNKRLAILPEIRQLFVAMRLNYENVVDVEVTAFSPLTESQQTKLEQQLERRLERKIKLNCQEDKKLLGGAVIKAGNKVFDGSILGKLRRMVDQIAI